MSVIVVNYNGLEFLGRCLQSVLSSRYPCFEIILVDNRSTDGSRDVAMKFAGHDGRIKVIYNEKNLGPAAGRNIGGKIGRGSYLAFIDNDTEVDPNWLDEAIKVMESDSKIGAIQCKLLLLDSPNRFDYAGDFLSPYGFLIQRVDAGAFDDGSLDSQTAIFSAKSAGMIVRRDVFKKAMGFDSDYFIYVEETDLCWRIWLLGYRVVFVPRSKVYHAFGRSSKRVTPFSRYLVRYHGSKNYVLTLLKNLSIDKLVEILPRHLVLWMAVSLWLILKRRPTEMAWIIGGIVWNLVNLRKVWEKRLIVQEQLRNMYDDAIWPSITRKESLRYFYRKASNPISGWWD